MPPTVIVSIALSIAGLLVAWPRWRWPTVAAAVPLGAIGAFTLAQHFRRADGHLETLALRPLGLGSGELGHMGPMAALCFLMTSIALLLLLESGARSGSRSVTVMLHGLGITGLALTSLAFKLVGDYGPLAPSTAQWCAGLGIALAIMGACRSRGCRARITTALFVGCAALAFTFTVSQLVRLQQRRNIRQAITLSAWNVKDRLDIVMGFEIDALDRLARRAARSPRPSSWWRKDAEVYLRDFDALRALAWLDDRPLALSVVSVDADWQAVVEGLDMTQFTDALAQGRRAVRAVSEGAGTGPATAVLLPFPSDGQASGGIVGIHDAKALIDVAVLHAVPEFNLAVKHGDTVLHRRGERDTRMEERWSKSLELEEAPWTVSTTLQRQALDASRAPHSITILILGVLVADLLAVALQLGGAARHDAKEAERAREDLEHEVTERRHAEEQLRQAQKMEAVGRLAGGIAHDFNNLLTAVLGFNELLASTLEDPKQREHSEQVERAATHGKLLTGQLLAFSRRQVLAPGPLQPNALVQDIRGMLTHLIGENIELQSELSPEPWSVLVDRGQLQQVLVNLVINARDAMPEGGRIVLRTTNVTLTDEHASSLGLDAGEHVRIDVEDSGCGMDEKTTQHAFEPFYTTKDVGDGSGLGLAVVHGIIAQSAGAVDVTSMVGCGSIFRIYLPRTVEGVADAAESPDESGLRARGEHVLLAEDDDAVRGLVGEVLANRGHRVLTAGSAEEALELAGASEDDLDLLVTDVCMPGRPGTHLAAELRARWPHLPVVFMSGHAEGAFEDLDLDSDPLSCFVAKPFRPDTLLSEVDRLLDESKVGPSSIG